MKNLLFILPALAALFSCNTPPSSNEIESVMRQAAAATPTIAAEPAETPITPPVVPAKTPMKSHYLKQTLVKDTDEVVQVHYELNPTVIDSIQHHAAFQLYDSSQYNHLAVSFFNSLSESLHGETYFAQNPDSVIGSMMDILTNRLEDGTDIVFLIDKTGSMEDDIDKVQASMQLIMDYLEKFSNVKVGIAAYGDKNWHYDFWYNKVQLTTDINELRNFMNSFEIIGNPDVAESVNDAIVRTVNEMEWTPGNRRLMMVIGDAPSLEPPLSYYSMEQVINKCNSMNIQFNLYPVLISAKAESMSDANFIKGDFTKLYPNPASSTLNVAVQDNGIFYYRVHDASGKILKQGLLNGRTTQLDVSDLSNGVYLLQVVNGDGSRFNSKQVVVQH